MGQNFEVSLINGVEVASFRGDSEGGTLEADLGMRDFTINSMAWDPSTGLLTDPYGGQDDLRQRLIRFTGNPEDRINEDPIRMVRACRFAARYGGEMDGQSQAAIRNRCRELGTGIAGERIRNEMIKAMAMEKPSLFFTLLHRTGLLSSIFPSLDRCAGLNGGPHHGETVFEHCLLVGDALPADQPLLRLAGYLHDTGKFDAVRFKAGQLTFAGHETHRDALASDLGQLRFSRRETDYILALVRAHMRPLTQDSTPRAVRRLLAMLADLGLSYRDFMRMRIADKRGNLAKSPYTLSDIKTRMRKLLDEMHGKNAFTMNDLEITGQDICRIMAMPPGPEIGKIKQHLFERVLDTPELNTRQRLVSMVEEMAR
ncbi:MAG TPA: tRNA nucleotidyltransferase [Desulfobacteraceae bacterium]|nr:tRNA nucleotidyltransferase [Desulfobacteraceae bacterium]